MSIPYQPGQRQPGGYPSPGQGQPSQYRQPGRGQPSQYERPELYGQQPYRCQSYTVRKGDTLSTLASQYGVSVNSIVTANPDMGLQRGQRICIPVSERR